MNSQNLFQKALTGLLVSILVFGSFSCKKEKDSEPEIPAGQLDPVLSDSDLDILDSASVDIQPYLDSLKDLSGVSFRQVFQNPNWRTRLALLEAPGRKATLPISQLIREDLVNIFIDGFGLCYENTLESNIRVREGELEDAPRQQKYAYVQVIKPLEKQIAYRQFPNVNNNALYKSKKLLGIDCSGFLGLILKRNGFSEFDLPKTYTGNFAAKADIAIKAKYSNKAEILNIPGELRRQGDFVIWNSHIAMILSDTKVQIDPICIQSNGTTEPRNRYNENGILTRTAEQDHKLNYDYPVGGIIRRGVCTKKLSLLLSSPFNLGSWKIYRIVPIIDKSIKASGDVQKGQENKKLPLPLTVKVLDKNGEGIPGLTIEFSVLSGGGSVSKSKAETKEDGTAEIEWTLGTKLAGNQKVKVRTKNFKGEYVVNGDLEYTATFDESTCGSTVSDIDGNVYNVVKIGTQCWTKTNLKTTRYRDGSAIPTGLSNSAWQNTTSGATAIYDNNTANNETYGKLYNFYAVADPKGLCPTGWHVPSDAEWTTLENFLGGASIAGGKLKAVSGWTSPNTGATDESGFSALPGGYRNYDGNYYYIGNYGYWWSSTEYSAGNAWFRVLYYGSGGSGRYGYVKRSGFSVRCLRD